MDSTTAQGPLSLLLVLGGFRPKRVVFSLFGDFFTCLCLALPSLG